MTDNSSTRTTRRQSLNRRPSKSLQSRTDCSFRRLRSIACVVALAGIIQLVVPSVALAQFNLAIGKPVIDGSGSWAGGVVGEGAPFDGGQFPARLAVDGLTSEPDDGTISYWLGREQTPEEYFTVDLGEAYEIDRIDLYNTHNRQFNDRGTDEFVILGATEVDADNALINPEPIVSGNLSDVSFEADIFADSFTEDNGLNVTTSRYLQFQAFSSIYGNGNVGLNELEVFSSAFDEVQPNRAFNKPVIDGSGAWDGGEVGVGAPFDGGDFPATAVTDGSVSDGLGTLWLGREGVPEEHFTLDLGEVVNVQEILLRNTANRQFADRGTMDFRILAANEVDGSNQLVNPTEILSGKLRNTAGINPLLESVFTADNGLTPGDARYLRFETENGTYFNANVGLNEIEVFEEVMHEPTPPPRDNKALGKPIIDGSGSWEGDVAGEGAPFDGGSFPAERVVDGSLADLNTGRNSYWLGREETTEEYFTLDLGEVITVEEVVLRNTHNTQHNDRGTDEFVLLGALEVDGDNQLIEPFPLASGNLSDVSGQVPIEADVFNEDSGLEVADARYLQFVALTYFGRSSGLNDIEVYSLSGIEGDFNGNGVLDAGDIDLLTQEMVGGADPLTTDLNDDGVVDMSDRTIWVEQLKNTHFGDSNLDGEFNSTDLVVVFQAGQYEDDVSQNSTWATGDWNGDQEFDSADFVMAFSAGGYEQGPRAAQIPEPAASTLIGMALATLVGVASRRRQK